MLFQPRIDFLNVTEAEGCFFGRGLGRSPVSDKPPLHWTQIWSFFKNLFSGLFSLLMVEKVSCYAPEHDVMSN